MMYNNQLTNTPAFRPLAGINRLVLNDPGRRLGKGRLFRACGIGYPSTCLIKELAVITRFTCHCHPVYIRRSK